MTPGPHAVLNVERSARRVPSLAVRVYQMPSYLRPRSANAHLERSISFFSLRCRQVVQKGHLLQLSSCCATTPSFPTVVYPISGLLVTFPSIPDSHDSPLVCTYRFPAQLCRLRRRFFVLTQFYTRLIRPPGVAEYVLIMGLRFIDCL